MNKKGQSIPPTPAYDTAYSSALQKGRSSPPSKLLSRHVKAQLLWIYPCGQVDIMHKVQAIGFKLLASLVS